VYVEEGRLAEAGRALNSARDVLKSLNPDEAKTAPPWWTLAWFNGLVTAENARDAEDFDRAAEQFRSILDPEKQPVERKFNFARDYVVINQLGSTLFKRSQLETEPEKRDPFLLEAIDRYESTLRIDPEDLDAHYGLSQAYRVLGLSMTSRAKSTEPIGTDLPSLQQLSAKLRDSKADKDDRLEAAALLGQALTALGKETTTARAPKRPRFDALVPDLRAFFHKEEPGEIRTACAFVLGNLHRELHAIYRPDDLARGLATRKHREKHPAANHAAEAIKIYPLNRKGAPGL
jgi:tetratricopeptide (TPR) repeat protein